MATQLSADHSTRNHPVPGEPRPYRDAVDWRAMLDLLVAGRRANNGTY